MKLVRLSVLFAIVLAGCVRTHETELSLTLPSQPSRIGGSEKVGIKISVKDLRADSELIGTLTSPYGSNGDWRIITKQPVATVVSQGLTQEFKARGFRLAEGPAYLLVDIVDIHSFASFNLMSTDVFGRAGFSVQVLNPRGEQLYAQTFRRLENATNKVVIGNKDEGKDQLQKVIASAIRDITEDDQLIIALFEASKN